MVTVKFCIYHGGKLDESSFQYKGGKTDMINHVDTDCLSIIEIQEIAKDLGYIDTIEWYYSFPSIEISKAMSSLKTDNDCLELAARILRENLREVYLYTSHRANNYSVDVGEPELSFHDDEENDINFDNACASTYSHLNSSQTNWDLDCSCDGNESEYANSDVLVTPNGSDDDSDGQPRFAEFNAEVDLENSITLVLGQKFENHVVFKKALKEFSIQNCFDYLFLNNDKWRVTAMCARNCGWRIHASPSGDKLCFQIKSYKAVHSCGSHEVNTKIDANWIAKKYLDHLRDTPNWNVEAFKKQVHRDHNVSVSLGQCYRAKRIAYELNQGSYDGQYSQLWDYSATVSRYNPGSTLRIVSPMSVFERFYVCLEACKVGFKTGCRPFIGLDGCHLKTKYGGQMLVAIGKDGNDNMYPIAYAVVENENKDSWTWFLDLLLHDIGSADNHGWLFMSDRQKGLIETFEQEFPTLHHRYCVRHLYANFKEKWKGKTFKDSFFGAAGATTQKRYNYWMEEIKKLDTKAFDWLTSKDPFCWSKHAFNPNIRCDTNVNNIAETFNSWILETRDKPILTMMETIRRKLMKRFQEKRDEMLKSNQQICPRIQKRLNKAKNDAYNCIVHWAGGSLYEVDHVYEGRLVVNLSETSCGCRKWDLTGVPCSHACGAIFHRKEQPEDYVDKYFTKTSFMAAYAPMIFPMPGPTDWVNTGRGTMQPPVFRPQPGRPKKARKRATDEVSASQPYKMTRKGGNLRCGTCKQLGHNSRSCKENKSKKTRVNHNASDGNMSIDNQARIGKLSVTRSQEPQATSSHAQRTPHSRQKLIERVAPTQRASSVPSQPPPLHRAATTQIEGSSMASQVHKVDYGAIERRAFNARLALTQKSVRAQRQDVGTLSSSTPRM